MKKQLSKLVYSGAISLFSGGFTASAATLMITPTAISYTNSPNQEATGIFLDNETNIINGSGLSAAPTISNVSTVTHSAVITTSPGNAWATIDPGAGGGDFYAQGGNAPVFTIDLGSTYVVTDFVYWGYHFGSKNGNSAKNITFEFSTDGGSTYGSPLAIVLTNAGATNASEVINFSGQNANFVRMTVTDNFFGTYTGGDRVGLSEIRFMGDAVPEPSAALLGGLGLIGLLRRRR